ncbi:MAG TPA: hypothetical protein VE961_20620 [Pyrinomonadaceae bacterium]|nr:hypothetical protein [Pyrinomonadaceae bacterium]
MNSHRLILFAAVILLVSTNVHAQRTRQRLPAPRDPQYYEPRNQLEDFETRVETLLIRGRHVIGHIRAQSGLVRVEATEIRDGATSATVSGAVITFIPDSGSPAGEIRSVIDYDEIDALLRAMDTAAKASESVTRLSHFEVRYRTKGDFEIMVFKQLENNTIAAAIEAGFFDRLRLYLSIDDLVKLRWMIAQAKERLDQK